MDLPGLVVPPLTPFSEDLSVDYDTLKREVDYIVEDCNAAMVSAAGAGAGGPRRAQAHEPQRVALSAVTKGDRGNARGLWDRQSLP